MFGKAYGNIIVAIIVTAFTGCATIIHGSSQEVTFNSNPEDATVTVNGKVIGKTPITTSLKKKSGQALRFEKEGYKPVSMQLETRMDPWFWGNILIGGLIGSTTDGVSGAVNEYSPNQYMVTLSQAGTSSIEFQTALTDRQKAINFIIAGYKEIVAELHEGQGQYLSSLFSLLQIPADNQTNAFIKLRFLLRDYPSIPEFAEHAVDALMQFRN